MMKIILIIVTLVSITYPSKTCDDEDSFYWPIMKDDLYIHLKKVNEYFKKEDSLLNKIKEFEINQRAIGHWRIYYEIYRNYEELEKISKGIHPKKEKYYKNLKCIYLIFSTEVRKFNEKKRRLRNSNEFKSIVL